MSPDPRQPDIRNYGDVTDTYADTTNTYASSAWHPAIYQSRPIHEQDSISCAITDYALETPTKEPARSGKCRLCGQFQSDMAYHENHCTARFRPIHRRRK